MKKTLNFVLMLMFLLGTIQAANIPVASTGDIAAAISEANDGDVIVLADGGTYAIAATIELEKTITIMAAEGSATKPKITVASGVSPTISGSATGAGITFIGLEIEGPAEGVQFIETSSGDSISHVKFYDVDLHDFGRCVIRSSNSGTYLGKVVVENSHIHDFTSSTWRLFWIRHNDISYVGFKNSTFNNFTESLLFLEGDDPGVTNVDVHNCTIDGKTTLDDNPIIKVVGEKGGYVSIKNSIFTNLESNTGLFLFDTNYTDIIANSRHYLVGNTIDITNDWSFESDFIEANPAYADAANNDFTLGNIDLLTAGTDGTPIGDPKWATVSVPTEIDVTSGGDIAAAISGANDGDVIVLADGGIYTISAKIELEKTITIKAAEGSVTKPKITVASGVSPTISGSATGAGITFIGLEIEGPAEGVQFIETSSGDSISHVKFYDVDLHDFGRCVIRSSNSDTYLGKLIVENSHIHDFTSSTWRMFWIRHNDISYVGFKNSTFNNFTESLLYLEGDDPGITNVDIHNCTVDGKTTLDDNAIIKVVGEKGGYLSIKNSIFTNLESNTGLFAIDTNYTDIIVNSRYYLTGNTIDVANDWSFESDFSEANPAYADAANNDFTLGNTDLLTAGTDGGPIGDPKWLTQNNNTEIEGLIAYWKFDETTGITATDELGISDGTLHNMADSLRVDGFVGKAIDFGKGADSAYIEVANNENIDFDSTTSFSISALINIQDINVNPDQNVLFKGNVSNDIDGRWYGIIFKENELRIAVDDRVDKSQLGFKNAHLVMNMDGWNHIVGVRDIDNDSLFIYLNGKKVASMLDKTKLDISTPLPLIIGNNPGYSQNFGGKLDELKLYNIALSADDIYNMADGYGLVSSDILVTSITIAGAGGATTVEEGATLQIEETVLPANATDASVTWNVTNGTGTATITDAGLLQGGNAGTVKVTAAAKDASGIVSDSLEITIVQAAIHVTNVSIKEATKDTLEIDLGEEKPLTAEITPTDAADKTVSWDSDKKDFVTVDKDGKIKGVKVGTAKVTVTTTDGGKIASVYVTVLDTASQTSIAVFTAEQLNLYPNPVLNSLTIENVHKINSITIYNSNGTVIKSLQNINTKSISINVCELNSGLYIIKAVTNNNEFFYSSAFMKK